MNKIHRPQRAMARETLRTPPICSLIGRHTVRPNPPTPTQRASAGRGRRPAKIASPRARSSDGNACNNAYHTWGFAYRCTLCRLFHLPLFITESSPRYPVLKSRVAPVCLAECGGPAPRAEPVTRLAAQNHQRRYAEPLKEKTRARGCFPAVLRRKMS